MSDTPYNSTTNLPPDKMTAGWQINASIPLFPSLPSQGWQCPLCRGVFSPTTPRCLNCTGKSEGASAVSMPVYCSSCGKSPCDRSRTGCGMSGVTPVTVTIVPCASCGATWGCSHGGYNTTVFTPTAGTTGLAGMLP